MLLQNVCMILEVRFRRCNPAGFLLSCGLMLSVSVLVLWFLIFDAYLETLLFVLVV